MSSIIAEKYANLLTLEDVVQLFKLLEKAIGNKAEAAKICGLERKTTYGWEIAKEIRLNTKKKVLAALIENLPEETLDFMTEKSVQASVDILRTYLFAIYEKAVDERNTSNFLRLTSKFEETRHKYASLIVDHLENEVGNMLELIPEKASELGVIFKPSPLNVVRLSEFSKLLLPSLIKAISMLRPYVPEGEIASIFNIPHEFVQTLSTVLQEHYIAIRMPTPMKIESTTAATLGLQESLLSEAKRKKPWIEAPIGVGSSEWLQPK